jgi:hypothetical protein
MGEGRPDVLRPTAGAAGTPMNHPTRHSAADVGAQRWVWRQGLAWH